MRSLFIIKKPNFRLILFCIFNLIYLLYYGINILPKIAYYLSVIVYIIVCIYEILSYRNYRININKFKSAKIIKLMGISILTIFTISIIIQTIHLDFQLYLFKYLLNLILPLLVAFCIIELDESRINEYILILFARQFFLFIITQGSNFSVSNILSINIFDSYSSIMENGEAHSFLILTIIFLYLNKSVLAIISTVLCVASFKRFCLIYCALTWIFFKFLPHKSVNNNIINLCKIIFILAPVFMNWLYSDAGALWFKATFHLDLNDFSSSRYALTTMVRESFNGDFNGYGSIKNFFATKGQYWAHIAAMHCDLLELMWECTIIAVIVYVNNLLEFARIDYRIFFVIMYFMIELVLTHFMSGFPEWLLLYLFIYLIIKEKKNLVSNFVTKDDK